MTANGALKSDFVLSGIFTLFGDQTTFSFQFPRKGSWHYRRLSFANVFCNCFPSEGISPSLKRYHVACVVARMLSKMAVGKKDRARQRDSYFVVRLCIERVSTLVTLAASKIFVCVVTEYSLILDYRIHWGASWRLPTLDLEHSWTFHGDKWSNYPTWGC